MLFAVSVSEIGQHIVGIRWHMFEVIVCHFKRASLSSRVVKEIYSLNNVETNLKTPHAHACSSAKSVHARACTFKALLHAFSFWSFDSSFYIFGSILHTIRLCFE